MVEHYDVELNLQLKLKFTEKKANVKPVQRTAPLGLEAHKMDHHGGVRVVFRRISLKDLLLEKWNPVV